MAYANGSALPVRALEETAFWKQQEKEHTEIIKAVVPQLEAPYVKLLDEWAAVLGATEQAVRLLLGAAQAQQNAGHSGLQAGAEQLLRTARAQSREFIRQLMALKEASAAVSASPLAGIVILHIIRESQHFTEHLEILAPEVQDAVRSTETTQNQGYQAVGHADHAGHAGHIGHAGDAAAPSLPFTDVRDQGTVPVGGHTLPPLPYPYNALEPYIDETTMRIHHDKHHQSYVDGLNKAELKLAEARKSGDFDLVKHWERELAFNGAGHYLHSIFWNVMSPQGGGRPTGALLDAIERSFGSYDAFKAQFSEAANKVEGGGWAILVWSPRSRRLEVLTAEKHQNLSQWDVVPLLALDVWEHAYYLKHQNNRADYIKDWWKVVNWPFVAERYNAARKLVWPPY
ncbi:Fe-Mn family superoxide dismutase [Paenibacillus tengchongensis]|uniref:Fe-Mn family superoxide dismutase n=1 Tax=Paenibacillus tengchongensis TaxID=2608684 RepID=UPI00124BF849|nr:Fe-Mn family superoxide dismutase [Paenibacillus tengchongensis]